LESEDLLPVVLHTDYGPTFGIGFVESLIELTDGGLAIVGIFTDGCSPSESAAPPARFPAAHLHYLLQVQRRVDVVHRWNPSISVPRLSGRLNIFLYAPCFASGIVAHDLIKHKRWRSTLPAWVWPTGILLLIALYGPFDNGNPRDKIHRAWALSLALGLLYTKAEEGSWGRIQSVFHWIAKHSYGIYLSHIVVLWIAFDLMPISPIWVKTLVLIIGAAGTPALLFVSVEKPSIMLGSRIATHLLKSHADIGIPQ
jgi:peptidoglycan/LPS O-acetylase OafA/YrhL